MSNRVIRIFRKEDESFVGEVAIPTEGILLEELQDIFDVPQNNPMYDCFPVTKKQAKVLQNKLNYNFDLDEYDYFVEYDET